MVNANDPVESFLNSIHVAFLPIESGIRKAAKDLELGLLGTRNKGRTSNSIESSGSDKSPKAEIFSAKKRASAHAQCVGSDDIDKKKGVSIKVPIKAFFGVFFPNNGGVKLDATSKKHEDKDKVACVSCLQFAMTWSLLVNSVLQAIPSPLKPGKKRCAKVCDEERMWMSAKAKVTSEGKKRDAKFQHLKECTDESVVSNKDGRRMPLECLIGLIFDQLIQNLQKLDQGEKAREDVECDSLCSPQFDHWKALTSFWESRKVDMDGFFGNLKFARVGGVPSSVVGVASDVNEEGDDSGRDENREETEGNSAQKIASGILSVPLSNVERLRSTLSTVSLTELIELIPQLGRTSKDDHPDKKKLFSVQDFFRYTESEGRRFFEELDRDGDGQVTLEDLEVEMRKRKLPRKYARELMRRARSHLFSKSFGWKQFLSLMEQKEPTILRAYTSLCLSKSGKLQKSEIVASLRNAGLPANEDNAVAMMRFLNADTEGSISYGHFRNFMLLLPSDRLKDDPRNVWFEAATVVAVAPPVEVPAGNVLKYALAGGLSSALSTSLMHPIDTIKTRVQASPQLTFPEVISKLPQIGRRGLYRGSIPAIVGQFSSHGMRTGIYEATKLLLVKIAPSIPDFQVQSVATFCGTFLGTALRIPCEVLKQRCQAGLFDNVGEAVIGTWRQDGLKGFFRGTGATLLREVPLYVAGTGLYEEFKKVAQHLLGRELEPWETITVGAFSGGLAAVLTTPFDVMKTRTMTAPQGQPVSMPMIAFSILRNEGALGLFKGAVPRFFWVAPLGAMNFAGYELAKKAMEKKEPLRDQLSQNKVAGAG